jgi:divinyl protochlorophyllide a 8-vinyl-reductase
MTQRTGSASIDRHGTSASGPDSVAEIGPNAVIQLIQALNAAGLQQAAVAIFAAAKADEWLAHPPSAMVDERPVARIHQAVRQILPAQQANAVLADAGLRTADYILANRIPKFAQVFLKLLPAPLAAKLLTKAIAAHAWTFAGSGRFTGRAGRPTVFEIAGNPLCAGEHSATPVCIWHAAVFQRLFQVLVSPRSRAVETDCGAHDADCCRFELNWGMPVQQPTVKIGGNVIAFQKPADADRNHQNSSRNRNEAS